MNPEINQVKSIVVIIVILLTGKGIYAQEVITIGFDIGIEQMNKGVSAFNTWAFSANFDCHITKNFLCRFGASSLINKDNIFTRLDGTITDTNTFLTTVLAMSF